MVAMNDQFSMAQGFNLDFPDSVHGETLPENISVDCEQEANNLDLPRQDVPTSHALSQQAAVAYVPHLSIIGAGAEVNQPILRESRASYVHGLTKIPVTLGGRRRQRLCVVCKQQHQRRDCRRQCSACPNGVALCGNEHFLQHHQQLVESGDLDVKTTALPRLTYFSDELKRLKRVWNEQNKQAEAAKPTTADSTDTASSAAGTVEAGSIVADELTMRHNEQAEDNRLRSLRAQLDQSLAEQDRLHKASETLNQLKRRLKQKSEEALRALDQIPQLENSEKYASSLAGVSSMDQSDGILESVEIPESLLAAVRLPLKSSVADQSRAMICTKCKRHFRSNGALRRHVQQAHPPLTCQLCGHVSKNVTGARSHLRTDHASQDQKPFCVACNRIFSSTSTLNKHRSLGNCQ